ncbi:MAG: ankyrin repeat domain-containing protein [Alphaproteobacteria bacterium]
MQTTNAFNGANQDSLDREFLASVKAGDEKRAQSFLDRGANVNARDEKDETALLWSAKNGQEAMVNMLLARKASPDAPDADGATALIHASMKGFVTMAASIIDAGADIMLEDRHGKKALDYAIATAEPQLVELFNKPMKTIIARIPTSDLAHVLRASKVDLDRVDTSTGQTMLTWAAGAKGQEHLARAFLEAGASPSATNGAGKTAVEVARETGNEPVLSMLEGAGKYKSPFARASSEGGKPGFSKP